MSSSLNTELLSFGWDFPVQFMYVSDEERAAGILTPMICALRDKWFFIKAALDLPIHGHQEVFSWGVWIAVSKEHFEEYQAWIAGQGEASGPYSGWLCVPIPVYPDTLNLRTQVQLNALGEFPNAVLEDHEPHPLLSEQQQGISVARVAEIQEFFAKMRANA